MTALKINPLTGHEDGLPDPRPRPEIWKEMLASHQIDPSTHMWDIYHRLEWILIDLKPFVDKELETLNKTAARLRRKGRKELGIVPRRRNIK